MPHPRLLTLAFLLLACAPTTLPQLPPPPPTECPAALSICGNVCVDRLTSPLHCGGCGIACASGARCLAGVCERPACVAPRADCTDDPSGGCGCFAATQLAVGDAHACARLTSGELRCWGDNERGQLGDGTTTARATPVQVVGLRDATQLTAGGSFTCARLRDATLRCWGMNGSGALGDGTTIDRLTPATVRGLTDVAEVRAGNWNTCARQSSGAVWCWGSSAFGVLGEGTTSRSEPVRVLDFADTLQLAVGRFHACARRRDDSLWCWGRSFFGEAGPAPESGRVLRPTRVPDLPAARDLALGTLRTCILTDNRRWRCLGAPWPGSSTSAPAEIPWEEPDAQLTIGGLQHGCVRTPAGDVRRIGHPITPAVKSVASGLQFGVGSVSRCTGSITRNAWT